MLPSKSHWRKKGAWQVFKTLDDNVFLTVNAATVGSSSPSFPGIVFLACFEGTITVSCQYREKRLCGTQDISLF